MNTPRRRVWILKVADMGCVPAMSILARVLGLLESERSLQRQSQRAHYHKTRGGCEGGKLAVRTLASNKIRSLQTRHTRRKTGTRCGVIVTGTGVMSALSHRMKAVTKTSLTHYPYQEGGGGSQTIFHLSVKSRRQIQPVLIISPK